MKLKLIVGLVFFGTLIFCTNVNCDSEIPRDNSHFKLGESRYIWMPDGEGILTLVDLERKFKSMSHLRPGETLTYRMYSGHNENCKGSPIEPGDVNTLVKSPYDRKLPFAVIIPDLGATENSYSSNSILEGFKKKGLWNIMTVDYRDLKQEHYSLAVDNVADLGKYLATHLNWVLTVAGGAWRNVHFVGVGFGAHVAGCAGLSVNGAPGRITGLDPTGPLFTKNSNRLSKDCAQYVEVFHTDWGVLGIAATLGHIDLFLNGGKNPQPSCTDNPCSHFLAAQYFAMTLIIDDILVANKCLDVNHALANRCDGKELAMGRSSLGFKGTGIYAVTAEFIQ